jgi:formylmethanofuran dehydrogenase subunit E
MSDTQIVREYRCEKCGGLVRTTNWELSGRIVCWQTVDGQCARQDR